MRERDRPMTATDLRAPAAAFDAGRPELGPDAPIAVRIEGLSKSFPLARTFGAAIRAPLRREMVPSLKAVTLSVRRGEFFGLLGPNGAGKTTLFRLLATSVLPDGGSATVNGFDVVRQPGSVRRQLTPVLANERSLNWRLSAVDNLLLFAAFYGVHGAAARERIREVLDVVALADSGEKMVANFSSGMRQRLLIARALLSRPNVLLLDEPTRSLDPISARSFREFVRRELCERSGATVLLATHSTEEALHFCDRVGVLHRGELLAVGTPDSLLREYADERYRVWVPVADERAVTAAAAAIGVPVVSARPAPEEGWVSVDLHVAGGSARAASALGDLVRAGVTVARYEPVSLSLADLIERIVHTRTEGRG